MLFEPSIRIGAPKTPHAVGYGRRKFRWRKNGRSSSKKSKKRKNSTAAHAGAGAEGQGQEFLTKSPPDIPAENGPGGGFPLPAVQEAGLCGGLPGGGRYPRLYPKGESEGDFTGAITTCGRPKMPCLPSAAGSVPRKSSAKASVLWAKRANRWPSATWNALCADYERQNGTGELPPKRPRPPARKLPLWGPALPG
jgi:hypothetical protein